MVQGSANILLSECSCKVLLKPDLLQSVLCLMLYQTVMSFPRHVEKDLYTIHTGNANSALKYNITIFNAMTLKSSFGYVDARL